jgi:hypothetical protein
MAGPDELRDEGNAACKAGDLARASELYTAAIDLHPEDASLKATLYRNRCIVRYRLEDFQGSEEDATQGERGGDSGIMG